MPAEPRKLPRGTTSFTVRRRPGMSDEESLARRVRALERLLDSSLEREQHAVAEGRACWIEPAPPPPTASTEQDIRRPPRYRPFKAGASRSNTGAGSR